MKTLLLLLLIPLLLVSCKSSSEEEAEKSVSLQFTYISEGGNKKVTDFSCEESECPRRFIDDVLWEPVAEGEACTQIFGGPDRILVRGDIFGEKIDSSFERTNGCEIARFDSVFPLLQQSYFK